MTPIEILRGAAEVIKERGWTQGRFTGHDGSKCIAGALQVSTDRLDPDLSIRTACWLAQAPSPLQKAMDALEEMVPRVDESFEPAYPAYKQRGNYVVWNDKLPRETGKQQVIDLLELAATALENNEMEKNR